MIIVCSNCASHLEVSNTESSPGLFAANCPKCQSDTQSSASANGNSPASPANRQFERLVPTLAFDRDESAPGSVVKNSENSDTADNGGVSQLLVALLQQSLTESIRDHGALNSAASEPHQAVVCVEPASRDVVERKLRESGYEVTTVSDAAQVFDRIRDQHIDVVILNPEDSQAEHGATLIEREISMLQPTKRRRIFFVYLSASTRTADSHQAFLKNVNLIVNTGDIEALSGILESARRYFTNLYNDFSKAPSIFAR